MQRRGHGHHVGDVFAPRQVPAAAPAGEQVLVQRGGAELALACDFRLMREGAHIGFVHGRLAITSAWGGGPDLASLIGPARALRMTARCEMVSAATALASIPTTCRTAAEDAIEQEFVEEVPTEQEALPSEEASSGDLLTDENFPSEGASVAPGEGWGVW